MLVSVIIPCYNVEDYIEECLDSVFNQTHQEVEVIAVNNRSTDQTLPILNTYRTKTGDKLTVLEESNAGAPFARNKGLEIAKGEWVQFLDADDLLEPEKIAHQLKLIAESAEAPVFVAGACKKRFVDGREIIKDVSEKHPFIVLMEGGLGNTCSNFWNREKLIEAGLWNTTLKSSQEPDLMFRMVKLKQEVLIDHVPLTIIRERPSGQISNKSLANRVRFVELRVKMLDYLKLNFPAVIDESSNSINQVFYYCVINMMRQDPVLASEYYRLVPRNFFPQGVKSKLIKLFMDVFGVKIVGRVLNMLNI